MVSSTIIKIFKCILKGLKTVTMPSIYIKKVIFYTISNRGFLGVKYEFRAFRSSIIPVYVLFK